MTIGAGSIVNKDISSNKIAVGNPCKEIKDVWDDFVLHKVYVIWQIGKKSI